MAVLSEKMDDYLLHRDEIDMVFLGSSQTFRHIDAPRINRLLDEAGIDLTVYNFGVPALTEPEMRYIADFIIENKSPRLKYVVLQNPLRAEGEFSNMMSQRGRFFRAPARAAETWTDVNCYTGTLMGKIKRYRNNAQAMTAEALGLGRLAQLAFPSDDESALKYASGYRDNDGFWPVDEDSNGHVVMRGKNTPMTRKSMDNFLAGKSDYIPDDKASTCRANELLETIGKNRKSGLKPLYFVSPSPKETGHDKAITEAISRADPTLPILDMSSPGRYPELFQPSLWFDHSHMKGNGAKALADLISPALIAHLQTSNIADARIANNDPVVPETP